LQVVGKQTLAIEELQTFNEAGLINDAHN